jgi:hypothetical protein
VTALTRKGEVFAIGHPWLYNEYIDREDNRKAGAALIRYFLKQS